MPKKHLAAAMKWLRDQGARKLISRTISVDFPAGQDEAAEALTKLLKDYEFDDKEGVHHSRLSAWVRRRMEAGEAVDKDLLGVQDLKVAKIE